MKPLFSGTKHTRAAVWLLTSLLAASAGLAQTAPRLDSVARLSAATLEAGTDLTYTLDITAGSNPVTSAGIVFQDSSGHSREFTTQIGGLTGSFGGTATFTGLGTWLNGPHTVTSIVIEDSAGNSVAYNRDGTINYSGSLQGAATHAFVLPLLDFVLTGALDSYDPPRLVAISLSSPPTLTSQGSLGYAFAVDAGSNGVAGIQVTIEDPAGDVGSFHEQAVNGTLSTSVDTSAWPAGTYSVVSVEIEDSLGYDVIYNSDGTITYAPGLTPGPATSPFSFKALDFNFAPSAGTPPPPPTTPSLVFLPSSGGPPPEAEPIPGLTLAAGVVITAPASAPTSTPVSPQASPPPTPPAVPTVASPVAAGDSSARLVNLSARALVGTGANVLIPGFVVAGNGTETVLIRADGPSLAQFGITGYLARPVMTVFDASGSVIASNSGWGNNSDPASVAAVAAQVGAYALPVGSADCALVVSLPAGAYTVEIAGFSGSTGIALAEIYEVSSSGTRLTNLSTRAMVGTGPNALIPGFVISGAGAETLLVRADGPSLGQFGVSGFLASPSLTVFDSSNTEVASNTGWGTDLQSSATAAAGSEVHAFALAAGSGDSAKVVSMAPGAYTVLVSGVGNATGVALAEIYEIPPQP